MRGRDGEQSSMFSYISAERRVPKDHPLRAIRAMADMALKQLSNVAVKPKTAIVGCQMHVGASLAEVLNPCRQIGSAHAVVKRHALNCSRGRLTAITPLTE